MRQLPLYLFFLSNHVVAGAAERGESPGARRRLLFSLSSSQIVSVSLVLFLFRQADRRARLGVSVHECGATPKYALAYDAHEGAFFFGLADVMCQGYWQKGSRNVDSTTCLLVQL